MIYDEGPPPWWQLLWYQMMEMFQSLPLVGGGGQFDDNDIGSGFGNHSGGHRRRGGGSGSMGGRSKTKRRKTRKTPHSSTGGSKPGGGISFNPSPTPSSGSGGANDPFDHSAVQPKIGENALDPNWKPSGPASADQGMRNATGGGMTGKSGWSLPGLGVGKGSPMVAPSLGDGGKPPNASNPGGLSRSDSIDSMLGKAGFSPSQFSTMRGIIQAESGGKVNATNSNTNGTIDRGLAQINSVHKQFDANKLLSDPQYNLNAAHEIYKSQGYKAWSTYNNGKYKNSAMQNSNMAVQNKAFSTPIHQPVAHPGTSATHVPFKAAAGNRGHATAHPPTPATAHTSPARNTRPAHAVSKATAGTQHTHSSGSKAGHPAAKKTTSKKKVAKKKK